MPPIPPETVAAYRAATYRFEHPDGSIAMHVGQHCAELAVLYVQHGASALAYVTACNPLGQLVTDEENARATAAFHTELAALGLPVFSGEGSDPSGTWREASFAVLGMGLDDARQLGQRWKQNAIVWADADAVPQLAFLR